MPDAPRDYLAEDEVALIDSGLPYLTEIWTDAEWRLYRVADPTPIGAEAGEPDSFTLDALGAGTFEPAINHNRYWQSDADDACVREQDGRTVVEVGRAGEYEFGVGLSGSGC